MDPKYEVRQDGYRELLRGLCEAMTKNQFVLLWITIVVIGGVLAYQNWQISGRLNDIHRAQPVYNPETGKPFKLDDY